jgi:GT2 family glycosyltransferase
MHLKIRQYYSYASSLGLSLATGDTIMLLSHDMIVPPGFVRMMLRAIDANPGFGLLRGSSQHMDCASQHTIAPPMPCRNYDDVCNFSDYVASYWGTEVVEDRAVLTDAIVIKRSVFDKVGVLDTRFRHLFGDIDWGLRIQRAGLKLGCAKGAWLHHEGGMHTRQMLASGTSEQEASREARELVAANYGLFRAKWGASLPA